MEMTKEKIQKCIDLLNTDGINSKEQVKKILQGELESIDNAEPNEAFETVYNNIDYLISDIVIEDDKVNGCLITIKEQLPTIKQALLKAQKPKQYLKWEDLEFKEERQEMFVLLNGSCYLLEYYTDNEEEFAFIKATSTTVFELLGERSDDKQFFNDLHLESVE